MKKLTLIILFIGIGNAVLAQDIIPDHTAKVYEFKGDIKSVTEKRYIYANNQFSLFTTNYYLLNEVGNITFGSYDEIGYSGNISKLYYYLYDSLNRLNKFIDIDDEYGDATEEYTYNKSGKVEAIKEYSTHPIYKYQVNHQVIYNADGYPKVREEYVAGKLDRFITYTYAGAKLTEQVAKNAAGKLLYSYQYTYDKGLKKAYTYTVDSTTTTIAYTYNKQGLISSVKTEAYLCTIDYLEFDKKGNWLIQRNRYAYFENNAEYVDVVYRRMIYQDGYMAGRVTPETADVKYNFNEVDFTKTTLTKNAENYTLNIEEFDDSYNLKSTLIGKSDDLLVYERNSAAAFFVKGYLNLANGTTVTPLFLSRNQHYWCKGNDGGYWLYYEGELLKDNATTWIGEDLLVYNNTYNKTFLLKQYKTVETNVLISADDITNEDNSYFKRSGNGFYLYSKGKLAGSITYCYLNDDMLVYDSTNQTSYLLADYKTTEGMDLHPAEEIVGQGRYICYKYNAGGSFYLVGEGKIIAGDMNAVYEGYNLIITVKDSLKKYIVYSYMLLEPGEAYIAAPLN